MSLINHGATFSGKHLKLHISSAFASDPNFLPPGRGPSDTAIPVSRCCINETDRQCAFTFMRNIYSWPASSSHSVQRCLFKRTPTIMRCGQRLKYFQGGGTV